MNSKSSKLLLSFLALTLAIPSAFAFEHGSPRGPVHRVPEHRWHEGHWVHDRHEGRLGWWWVAGGIWTFFARPVHETVIVRQAPAPAPVTVIQTVPAAPPASVPVFYYCKSSGAYYPDAMTCPTGWITVNAKTPPDLGAPTAG